MLALAFITDYPGSSMQDGVIGEEQGIIVLASSSTSLQWQEELQE